MRKLTNEEFILKSNKKHDNLYDYSSVEYINNSTKVIIICKKHGEFKQIPNAHLMGQGCNKCNNGIKYTKNCFINKASEIHNFKYDYSNIEYLNSNTKVKIICKKHGPFFQLPNNHISGQGCSKCCGKNKNTEDFIESSKNIHGDKFIYDKLVYKDSNTRVKIICKKHGPFFQLPNNHLNSIHSCPKCYLNRLSNSTEFIFKADLIHNNLYDYSKVNYFGAKDKVIIVCKQHGEFKQTPTHHLSGKGCPICKLSKGELKILKYFVENNYKYYTQHKFDGFNYLFDFYLPDQNICIEYDGIQHFKPISYFGGEKGFKELKERDNKKDIYCKENKIYLIRISYENYNYINNILDEIKINL